MISYLLTGLRVVLAIPIAYALAFPSSAYGAFAFYGVVIAVITDILDGQAARRAGVSSRFTHLFDHTADFVFVTAGLFGLAYAGIVPIALPILIVFAFGQYVLDSFFLNRSVQLRMSNLGRWNGLFYFAPLLLAGLARVGWIGDFETVLLTATEWLAYLLILSTVLSVFDRALAAIATARNKPG